MFFLEKDCPSCASCHYATEYIPYYTFPFSDPYCSKGHGKCKIDKVCGDYRLINSHFCYECYFCEENYCNKKRRENVNNNKACVYFKMVEG